MPPESPDTPAARLRSLRERAGLTQARLAARVGWTDGRISAIELGPWRPKLATVTRLAAALGCEPGEIDPDLGEMRVPRGALCLTPDPDLEGAYRPRRPADAGKLLELGWPEAVDHSRLAELSEVCRAGGFGLYLMP